MTSSSQQLAELLDIVDDIIVYVDKAGLKDLLARNKSKFVVLLYKLLDMKTKREIRKRGFYFLLKTIDSYDDLNADKEYIALFNYALDHPLVRESSQKPMYILEFHHGTNSMNNVANKMFNEYQQQFLNFQELDKLISENATAASRSEEGIKV